MVRLIFLLLLAASALVGLILIGAYLTIARTTDPFVFDQLDDIPTREVGLVLGCTPLLLDGSPNMYFEHRMDAAAELWRAGKVEKLLLSGDNSDHRYDEPQFMRKALLKRGVDDSIILLDRAGLRTLDSVVRAKRNFGVADPIIVSQEFHNRRALFIATHFEIDAVGFNARDVAPNRGFRTKTREAFARVKTVLDVFLLGTQPLEPGNPDPGESEGEPDG